MTMSGNVSPTSGMRPPRRLRQTEDVGRCCVNELGESGFSEFDEEETNVTVFESSGTC